MQRTGSLYQLAMFNSIVKKSYPTFATATDGDITFIVDDDFEVSNMPELINEIVGAAYPTGALHTISRATSLPLIDRFSLPQNEDAFLAATCRYIQSNVDGSGDMVTEFNVGNAEKLVMVCIKVQDVSLATNSYVSPQVSYLVSENDLTLTVIPNVAPSPSSCQKGETQYWYIPVYLPGNYRGQKIHVALNISPSGSGHWSQSVFVFEPLNQTIFQYCSIGPGTNALSMSSGGSFTLEMTSWYNTFLLPRGDAVKIEFSADSGTTWSTISSGSVPADGSITPDPATLQATATARLRFTRVIKPTDSLTSAVFTVTE